MQEQKNSASENESRLAAPPSPIYIPCHFLPLSAIDLGFSVSVCSVNFNIRRPAVLNTARITIYQYVVMWMYFGERERGKSMTWTDVG